MPRAKNPRRAALEDLRAMKRLVSWLIDRWNIPGHVYVEPADRKPGENMWRRDRQPHEYPENNPVRWDELAQALEELSEAAGRVALSARYRARALRKERTGGDTTSG